MEISENDIFKLFGKVADEGYFIFDITANKIVYVGNACERIFGISAGDIQRQPELLWTLFNAEDHQYIKENLAQLKKGETVKAEFRILKDGKTKYICLNAYNISEAPQLVAGNVNDITNLKNNIFYTEKINARKNAMLAIVAHDLKEPVAIINLMASAMKRDTAVAGNNNLLNNIKVIQDLCDRNISLIKELMKEEFLESPEVGLKKERAELVRSINDTIKQYQSSQSVLEQRFVFRHVDKELYAVVDMLKIAQSINNLIVNAIKFTPPGGQIEVVLEDMGDSVRISVADNGIGIPADLQPYLFEHRTRAHRIGLRGEEGAGIGLSSIRLLVELHNGKVWVKSREGEGSTFSIDLPKAL